MFFPALILFALFLFLSAFFSSSETSFIAASPYKLDYLEKKGSKKARLVKRMLERVDQLLATILIGNTLVNVAAAAVATSVFVSLLPNTNQAVLLATVVTTVSILILAEITPKTYAAHNPLKLVFLFIWPVRFFVILFSPFVKVFILLNQFFFPSSKKKEPAFARAFEEEEIKLLLTGGIKGMSALRKKMISGVLDIGTRPIREVMIPRPQVKAIDAGSSTQQILETILSAGFSRFPVYRGRLDNIEGLIHARDIIPYIIDNKEIKLNELLRRPFFLPESASLEKTLLQMQETANHLVFVVDEFGTVEGIVTLEDIIEEIVGEIEDEYDSKIEEPVTQVEGNVYVVRGGTPIKDINRRLPLGLPERKEYTTIAGFFLYFFGKIPLEGESLDYGGHRFVAEKMSKRHISLLRIILHARREEGEDENRRHQ